MAFVGHSIAQMPQPLQNRKSISIGLVFLIAISGQNNQQLKQPIHFSVIRTGLMALHVPVSPASPSSGTFIGITYSLFFLFFEVICDAPHSFSPLSEENCEIYHIIR